MGQDNSSEAELARTGVAMAQDVSIPPLAKSRRSDKHRRKVSHSNDNGLDEAHTQDATGARRRSSLRPLHRHDEPPPAMSGGTGAVLAPATLKRTGNSTLGKSDGATYHTSHGVSPRHVMRNTVQAVAASAWSSSTQSPTLGLQRVPSRRDLSYGGDFSGTLDGAASRPVAQPPVRLQPLPLPTSAASPSALAGPLLSPSSQARQQPPSPQPLVQSLPNRPQPPTSLTRLAVVANSARDDGPLAWRPTTPPNLPARRAMSQANMAAGFDAGAMGADGGQLSTLQPFQPSALSMQTALVLPDTTTILGSDEARRERESVSTATTGLTRRRSSVTINMNASVVLDSDAEEGAYDSSAGLRYTPSAPLQNPTNTSPKSILKKVSSFRVTNHCSAGMSSSSPAAGPVQLALRNARRQGDLESADNNEAHGAHHSSRQPRSRRGSEERAGDAGGVGGMAGEDWNGVLQLHPESGASEADFASPTAARSFAGRRFGRPLSLAPVAMQAGERERSITMPEPRQLTAAPTLQRLWQRSPMLVLYEIPLRGRHGASRNTTTTGSSNGGVDDADYPVETYGDDCTLIKMKTTAGGSGTSFKVDELIAHRKASVAIDAKLLRRASKLFVAGYTTSVFALDHGSLVNRHAAPLESPSCLAVQKLVFDALAEVNRLQELMRVVSPCDYDLYFHPTTEDMDNDDMRSITVARTMQSSCSSNNTVLTGEQASRASSAASSRLGVTGTRDATLQLVCSLALVRRASSEEGTRDAPEAMYTSTEESVFECIDLFDTTAPAVGQPLKVCSSVLHGSYLTKLTYHPVTDESQFSALFINAQARAAEYVSREFADPTGTGGEDSTSTSGLYFYVLTCLLTRRSGDLAMLTLEQVSRTALSAMLANQAGTELTLDSDEDDFLSTPVAVRRRLSASLVAPAGATGADAGDLIVSSLTCVMAEDRLGVFDAALERDQVRVPMVFFDGVLGAPCESHVVLGIDPRDATSAAALEMQSRVATKLHRHGHYGSVRQFLGEAAVVAGTHTPRAHTTGTGEADATSWKEKQLRKLQEVREVERLVRHVQTHGSCEFAG